MPHVHSNEDPAQQQQKQSENTQLSKNLSEHTLKFIKD